jgi:hypothetical protein
MDDAGQDHGGRLPLHAREFPAQEGPVVEGPLDGEVDAVPRDVADAGRQANALWYVRGLAASLPVAGVSEPNVSQRRRAAGELLGKWRQVLLGVEDLHVGQ